MYLTILLLSNYCCYSPPGVETPSPSNNKPRSNKPNPGGRRCNMSSMPSTPKWNGKATPAVSPFSGAHWNQHCRLCSSRLRPFPALFRRRFSSAYSTSSASAFRYPDEEHSVHFSRRPSMRQPWTGAMQRAERMTCLARVWRHNFQPTYLTQSLYYRYSSRRALAGLVTNLPCR